jgi:hypothetical protein
MLLFSLFKSEAMMNKITKFGKTIILCSLLLFRMHWSYPIIDIFYLYQSSILNENTFSHDFDTHWLAADAIKNNIAWNRSNLRVHLFGNEMTQLKKHSKDFELVSLSDFKNITRRFEKAYTHLSVNPQSYEFWCFNRWLLYPAYITSRSDLNISTVLVVDNDVVIFEDLSRFVNFSIQKAAGILLKFITSVIIYMHAYIHTYIHTARNYVTECHIIEVSYLRDTYSQYINVNTGNASIVEVVSVIPGALSIWSSSGLQYYSQYISNLYTHTNKSELTNYVKKHGGIVNKVRHFINRVHMFIYVCMYVCM